MGLASTIRPLLVTRQRREVLLALTAAYMLVQLSSLPVALSLPSLADYFGAGVDEAAWIVIVYLLALGSLVLLAARLGDRYGHARVFFVGLIATTIGSGLIAAAGSLEQIILWRAFTGFGAAFVMGNANAILAGTFPQEERGRAFAIPIMGARLGTLTGLAVFGLFLEFLSWRLVFLSFVPIGILAIAASIPMLRQRRHSTGTTRAPIDLVGGALFVATAAALILSGNHLHGGDGSFTSSEGLQYHLPMQVLFLLLLGAFILVERHVKSPLMDMGHFRQKYFTMALTSNTTYHFSMLATMTLVPILVERGFGMSPLWVTVVLLPNQILGLIMPLVAGAIHDRYQPRLLRPAALVGIAGGFVLLGTLAGSVPIWGLPLLMIPISIGTSVFNPINNAAVMSSLPSEDRGFASGMLETTRELGHALGATMSAAALALVLPIGIEALTKTQAQPYFVEGFQLSAMLVVLVLLAGGTIAYFHKSVQAQSRPTAAPEASYQSGDD